MVLAPGLARDEDISLLAGKIIAALSAPITIEGRDFTIGASIGCALYPDHGEDAESLLNHADAAMYLARRSGGGTHAIYRAAQEPAAALTGPAGD